MTRERPSRWNTAAEPWRFDGNDHDRRVVLYVLLDVEEFSADAFDTLLAQTVVNDDLSWLLLPTNGFRL